MEGNFLGVGLKNLIGITVFVMLAIVVLKVATLKVESTPEGLRNVVQTL